VTSDVWSTDGRFRFSPRNPFDRAPRWWRCYVGNSDEVCDSGPLPQLRLYADGGAFDHLITPTTSLTHSHQEIGF
jgi:hypothetical protein